MAAVEQLVSARVPTRWINQMEGQLDDAERRLASADAQLAAEAGGRALEEVYPGVMGAAMVRVWLTDEPWHTTRSLADMSRLVREALPSGFQALFEMKSEQRSFAGWRAEDARPLVEEARTFVASVRAEVERCKAPPTA
ncbi:MAG: hypothetical protein ACHQU1_00775 [Gemmatimonadales bacterium]